LKLALELAREGARVFVNGRTEKRVWDAVRRIREEVSSAQVTASPKTSPVQPVARTSSVV